MFDKGEMPVGISSFFFPSRHKRLIFFGALGLYFLCKRIFQQGAGK